MEAGTHQATTKVAKAHPTAGMQTIPPGDDRLHIPVWAGLRERGGAKGLNSAGVSSFAPNSLAIMEFLIDAKEMIFHLVLSENQVFKFSFPQWKGYKRNKNFGVVGGGGSREWHLGGDAGKIILWHILCA